MLAAYRARQGSGGGANGVVDAGRERAAGNAPFEPDDPRALVSALPEALVARRAWLVSELDASRGLAGRPTSDTSSPGPTRARRRSRGSDAPRGAVFGPDDVPDPHVLGSELHESAIAQIRAMVDIFVALTRSAS